MLPEGIKERRQCLTCEDADCQLNKILSELQDLHGAFPEGPLKHREAHEVWMASKKAEEAFWKDLKLDIAKKGIWGLLVIITGLILVGFATKLGIAVSVK